MWNKVSWFLRECLERLMVVNRRTAEERADEAALLFEKFRLGGLAYLQTLQSDKATETPILEFKTKADNDGLRDKAKLLSSDKNNLAKSLSGFANTSGGVLVWGVYCNSIKNGPDIVQELRPIADLTKFYTNLMDQYGSHTDPPVTGVRFEKIEADHGSDSGFVVMHIPKHKPSNVLIYGKTTERSAYYERVGTNFQEMSTYKYRARSLEIQIDDKYPDNDRLRQRLASAVETRFLTPHQQSCSSGVRLRLRVTRQPGALNTRFEIETVPGPEEILPPDTDVYTAFREQSPSRSLLILGEEASGKSDLLFDIALDCLTQRRHTDAGAIPVFIRLAHWNKDYRNFGEWLEGECEDKYGIPRKYGKQWILDDSLVLLLDGLDEVHPGRRLSCLKAINEFIKSPVHADIVLTCRSDAYRSLREKLHFKDALCIQELDDEQVLEYLEKSGASQNLIAQIFEDEEFHELARQPLWLKLMSLGFAGTEKLPMDLEYEDRLKAILGKYVERVLEGTFTTKPGHKIRRYSLDQAKQWLSWIASRTFIFNHRSDEFSIEKLAPLWLEGAWPLVYLSLFLFPALALWATMFWGYLNAHDFNVELGKLFGLLVWPLIILTFGTVLALAIRPVETLSLNWTAIKNYYVSPFRFIIKHLTRWRSASRKRALATICGVVVGLPAIIFGLVAYGIFVGRSLGPVILFGFLLGFAVLAVIVYLVIFPILVLPFWLRGPDLEKRQRANQATWNSLLNGLIGGLIVMTLSIPLNFWMYAGKPLGGRLEFFAWTFVLGFLITGGFAFIQHFWLRGVIAMSGALPWSLVVFLDYVADRRILKKEGGVYKFEHGIIQGYLADNNWPRQLTGAKMMGKFADWYCGKQDADEQ